MRPAAPPTSELVQLLLAQAEDYGVFFTDARGFITDWFPGAERIFGYSAQEMVGQSIERLFNREDFDRGAPHYELEMARTAGRSEDDRWHVRKDGTQFWGSGTTIVLRDAAGTVVAFAKLLRNRTDLKTQTETLEREAEVLRRRDEHARNFLAILGHELRNPLAPMTNAVHLIKGSTADGPVVEQALRVLDRQMAVIARLVDDILETTRVTTGKVDLQCREIDLRDVLRAVADGVRSQAAARQQEMHLVMVETAVVVYADPDRLHQVLSNLATNAVKYTPPGGKIVLNLTVEGGEAVARVEDNGIGMDAGVLPTVFDLFTQEDASRHASGGGLGLGLPLVRELVRAHGGTVQARSDGRGKGSVFTVRLPLRGTSQA